MRIVIVGGGSAGTACAFELRKLNKEIEIIVFEKSNHMAYSPCAMPYLISSEIPNKEAIFLYKKSDYDNNQIDLRLNTEVVNVDCKLKKISYITNNEEKQTSYDKLVLALGSKACADFQTLKTIDDVDKIKSGTKSVVVGGGMIGTELAYALMMKDHEVSLLEIKDHILSNMLDKEMAGYLDFDGLKVVVNALISNENSKLICNGQEISYDNLFMCTGVVSNLDLAKKIGLKIDLGIMVNQYLMTSEEDVFACGDCVESTCLVTGRKVLSQLGTNAVRQAKVVALNILGNKVGFDGVLNNTVTKLGNLYVGSVGVIELNEQMVSGKYVGTVRSDYYSDSEKMIVKLICNFNEEVIGGQIIGHAEVTGRLNLISLAIENKIKLSQLVNLETCYNPASASIYDPVVMAALICLKKIKFLKDQND